MTKKNYLCAMASGSNMQKLVVIDVQAQRVAASVQLSDTGFNDAVQPLAAELIALYPTPVQLEAPSFQQIGVTADYFPIYMSCLMLTASGATQSTVGITLYAVTTEGFTSYLTYTKTFTTPTAIANQAMFLGADGTTAYVSFPSDDGTTHRILAVSVDGTTTEQTSPLSSLPSVAAGMLGDGTNTYLAFGKSNAGSTGAELWTLTGNAWARTQYSLDQWADATVYPQSVPLALAAAAGITPTWFDGRVSPAVVGNSTGSLVPQAYDANGAYKLTDANVKDANTGAVLFSINDLLESVGVESPTVEAMYQNFTYLDEITISFWQNLVLCDEVTV